MIHWKKTENYCHHVQSSYNSVHYNIVWIHVHHVLQMDPDFLLYVACIEK